MWEPEIGALTGENIFSNLNVHNGGGKKKVTLPHTAYDKYRGWIATRPQGHPELPLQAAVCESGYQQLEIPQPRTPHKRVDIKILLDTGAQTTVVGRRFMHALGIRRFELIPFACGVTQPTTRS